jgi:ribosomal protein S18 acetylase RimI-like enzyme
LLQGLFNALEKIEYKNLPLKAVDYVVVGQLCVAKNYRGLGLVQKIYGHFRTELQSRYPFCITDVARANPRSLKAHLKTGFQVIDSVFYGEMDWDIVLWDWNNNGH